MSFKLFVWPKYFVDERTITTMRFNHHIILQATYIIRPSTNETVGFSWMGDIDNTTAPCSKLTNCQQVPRQLALRVTKFAEHAYSKQREASRVVGWKFAVGSWKVLPLTKRLITGDNLWLEAREQWKD